MKKITGLEFLAVLFNGFIGSSLLVDAIKNGSNGYIYASVVCLLASFISGLCAQRGHEITKLTQEYSDVNHQRLHALKEKDEAAQQLSLLRQKYSRTNQPRSGGKFVKNQIEAGVGTKTQQTQGFAPQRPERTPAYEVKEEKRLQRLSKSAAIANDIFTSGIKSANIRRIKDAGLKNGIDSPDIKVHMIRDQQGNVSVGSIDLTGLKLVADAEGQKRKKVREIMKKFTNPEDVYTYLFPKLDPLASATDYEEGNDYLMGGGASQPAPASSGLNRVSSEGWQ